jgi:hypothetical protein
MSVNPTTTVLAPKLSTTVSISKSYLSVVSIGIIEIADILYADITTTTTMAPIATTTTTAAPTTTTTPNTLDGGGFGDTPQGTFDGGLF